MRLVHLGIQRLFGCDKASGNPTAFCIPRSTRQFEVAHPGKRSPTCPHLSAIRAILNQLSSTLLLLSCLLISSHLPLTQTNTYSAECTTPSSLEPEVRASNSPLAPPCTSPVRRRRETRANPRLAAARRGLLSGDLAWHFASMHTSRVCGGPPPLAHACMHECMLA